MNASEDQLQQVYDALNEYQTRIDTGDSLQERADAVELDVEHGRIWLHPQADGQTVDIHLFDDSGERDFGPARSRISNHLSRNQGFRDIHTPFIGNDRMSFRVTYTETESQPEVSQ